MTYFFLENVSCPYAKWMYFAYLIFLKNIFVNDSVLYVFYRYCKYLLHSVILSALLLFVFFQSSIWLNRSIVEVSMNITITMLLLLQLNKEINTILKVEASHEVIFRYYDLNCIVLYYLDIKFSGSWLSFKDYRQRRGYIAVAIRSRRYSSCTRM